MHETDNVCVIITIERTIVFSTCIIVCRGRAYVCVLNASALCMCCVQEYMQ